MFKRYRDVDIGTFLVQCLNSVQYGLLLFLLASGLTLIFGIMGVINLAHGSFYMIGAYMAFSLAPLFGDQFIMMLLAGVVLAALFGYVLEWAFFSYLYQRDHLQQVLMTYGLILVFEELRSLLVGNDVHGVKVPPWLDGSFALGDLMSYPWYRLFASAACIAVAGWICAHDGLSPCWASLAGASGARRVRDGDRLDLRQPDAVWPRRGPQPLSA